MRSLIERIDEALGQFIARPVTQHSAESWSTSYRWHEGEHHYEASIDNLGSDDGHPRYNVNFGVVRHHPQHGEYVDYKSTINGVDATNVLATTHAALTHHLRDVVSKNHPKATRVTYAFAATADHAGQVASDSQRDRLYRAYHSSKRHENDPVLRGTNRVTEIPKNPTDYTQLHVHFPEPLAKHLANRAG